MPKPTNNTTAKAKTSIGSPHTSASASLVPKPGKSTPAEADPLDDKKSVSEKKRFCGVKGKSGPPKGNTNSIRHGLLSGKMPKGCQYVENRMNSFRRQLEAEVIVVHGSVSIVQAASINTAVKWERHGMLAQRWLRLECDDLKPADKLAFSREIAKASTERDKALAQLGLDAPPKAPWEIEA